MHNWVSDWFYIGCVLVNLLQCDSRKGLPFPVFFALLQHIFGFFIRVHNSCLAAANGAFVSIKIVFSNHFSTVFRLCKNCFDKPSLGKIWTAQQDFRTLEVNNQVVNSHLLDTTTLEIDLVVHKFFRWHCPVISTPRAATTLIIIIRDLTTSKQKRSLTD